MKRIYNKTAVLLFFGFFCIFSPIIIVAQNRDQMIRISEIEIVPEYLEQYKTILKEESEAFVRLEPGVIAIFSIFKEKILHNCEF